MDNDVVVVIGAGGMGQAVARRQGPGRKLVLVDFDDGALRETAARFRGEGYDVEFHRIDVSKREAVADLARAAADLGPISQVVHTAGLSPTQASAAAILAVDLAGTAYVLEEFGRVIEPGGAGVVISSMAGHLGASTLAPEQERQLAEVAADDLMGLPWVAEGTLADPGAAYAVAKRANQLRVQSASAAWGARGARVNSISPGVVSTPMGQQELASTSGDFMRAMIESSGTGRIGTPDDVAAAVAFLLSDAARFVTGTDLLVDGGVVAALRTGWLRMPQ